MSCTQEYMESRIFASSKQEKPVSLGLTRRHSYTGGQLQIDAQSSEGNSFLLYVLTLCLAANMCNFVRFFHSSTA